MYSHRLDILTIMTRTMMFVLQIHLDMCRYHELGRFLRDGETEYDRCAALFHLELAAQCGLIEALLTVARIALGSDHELLKDVNGPVCALLMICSICRL